MKFNPKKFSSNKTNIFTKVMKYLHELSFRNDIKHELSFLSFKIASSIKECK